ncbi:MAG: SSS family solute:Na+ symporter [Marinoscillum sp.]|jgi:SSS family solute:Na+ symporter
MAFSIGAIPVQEIYQRAFSAKSEKAGVNGHYLSAALLLLIPSIPLVIGLGSVYLHPELIDDDHGQSIILQSVARFASLPVQVLFYGAMISAIMSTSSGAMLASATVVGENLLKPNFKSLSNKQILLFTRLSVVLMVAMSCYFALGDMKIVSLVVASLSLIMVSILAPFTLGLFWKKSSVFGTWCGVIVGDVVWFICYMLDIPLDPTLIGTPASFVAMFIGSLIVADKEPIPLS